jgi:uncharacterized protein YuzE
MDFQWYRRPAARLTRALRRPRIDAMPSSPVSVTLFEALPELVYDIEGALVRLGRGKVADQLRDAPLLAWAYDDFAQSTYLSLRASIDPGEIGEVISLQDEIGVSLDLDGQRRVMGIEVSGYEDFLARLDKRAAC